MGLKPDPFISKPMDYREKTDRDTANSFVKKMAKINEVLKKQIAFAQIHMNITRMSINKTLPITF